MVFMCPALYFPDGHGKKSIGQNIGFTYNVQLAGVLGIEDY